MSQTIPTYEITDKHVEQDEQIRAELAELVDVSTFESNEVEYSISGDMIILGTIHTECGEYLVQQNRTNGDFEIWCDIRGILVRTGTVKRMAHTVNMDFMPNRVQW